jgi:hypothetical protein
MPQSKNPGKDNKEDQTKEARRPVDGDQIRREIEEAERRRREGAPTMPGRDQRHAAERDDNDWG